MRSGGARLLRPQVEAVGELLDQRQRQPTLVAHQTDGGLVHHLVQPHQILRFGVIVVVEVVLQIRLELVALLVQIGEVDEESRAHVPFQILDLFRRFRRVTANQQVAVLEQAAAANVLRQPSGDQFVLQV